ncbi:MAG: 4Fe-4S dicluster domain-containing protein, partial [Desulfobulbaceae bacterium]|nr:4Fe-4S dicluster domain-containing protein [Desulfobulbaceae bacterium]
MPTRRDFLKGLGATAAVAVTAGAVSVSASGHGEHHGPEIYEESYGVLTDLTKCVGCRQCEWACNEENKLRPSEPVESLEDQSIFDKFRRPDDERYTVVNRYKGKGLGGSDMFVKVQCMHCDYPPCVSACLVGALKKDPWGPVTYDAWKCIGCRYCMQACPWQIPAYEYNNLVTPRVMKCTMCFSRTTTEHEPKPDIKPSNFLGRGLPPQEKG